ncbi:hypothetical protein KR018_000556 [Drosophila ironensis]|nr:hypothetical protein KR018_000556 [Drosophila ironensis]
MCDFHCCQKRSPIAKRLAAKRLQEIQEEEARKRPEPIVETPQSAYFEFDVVEAMATYIMSRCELRPKYGMICGTLLHRITTLLEEPITIPFEDIPFFPNVTRTCFTMCAFVVGHIRGVPVMAMTDRFHKYDGYELAVCTLPVRVMQICGIDTIILSCCCSAANTLYDPGDIVIIKDHLNFMGMMHQTPLIGPSDPRFGGRFVPMVNAYDREMIETAEKISEQLGLSAHTGVIAFMGGPAQMSGAEEAMLRKLKVDVVAMGLVPEAIVAHHAGIKIFAFAFVTVVAIEKPEPDQSDVDPRMRTSIHEEGIPCNKLRGCTDLVGRLIYRLQNKR